MFFLIWVACGCLCFRDLSSELLFFDILYIFCGIEWGYIWDMHITKGIHQGLATEMEVSARNGGFTNQNGNPSLANKHGKLGRGDGRRSALLNPFDRDDCDKHIEIFRVFIASSIYSHHCIQNFHGASQRLNHY
jgi:hypothetical protein